MLSFAFISLYRWCSYDLHVFDGRRIRAGRRATRPAARLRMARAAAHRNATCRRLGAHLRHYASSPLPRTARRRCGAVISKAGGELQTLSASPPHISAACAGALLPCLLLLSAKNRGGGASAGAEERNAAAVRIGLVSPRDTPSGSLLANILLNRALYRHLRWGRVGRRRQGRGAPTGGSETRRRRRLQGRNTAAARRTFTTCCSPLRSRASTPAEQATIAVRGSDISARQHGLNLQ